MSEKIVSLNEDVINRQLKELVRGSVEETLNELLAIVTSIGTPAAPSAGAVILFTILSGVGFGNEMALSSSPSTGPSRCWSLPSTWPAPMFVAKSENALDEARYEI